MSILQSIAKSIKLRKLSKRLGAESTVAEILSNDNKDKDNALNDLLQMCEADESVAAAMSQYGASRDELKELYYQLLANGAGQWVAGHYVAASTVASYQPLSYTLGALRKGDSLRDISFQLTEYFRNGDIALKQN